MQRFLRQFIRFWQAEEVPRWFGISIVVIYLAGLGGVAQVGIDYANESRIESLRRSSEHATSLLADRLSSIDPSDSATLQRVLREYSSHTGVLALRLLNGERQIVASIDASEIGTLSPVPSLGSITPRRLEVVDLAQSDFGRPVCVLRAPVLIAEGTAVQTVGPPSSDKKGAEATLSYHLESVMSFDATDSNNPARHAGTLMVVLCVCGALFVIYRRLRRQMHGMSRIAQQLEIHGNHLEAELGALRVADSAGALARQWNQLIDLVETLQSEVRRSKATGELSRALGKRSGGALAEALHSAHSGILYINGTGTIEYANATIRRLIGMSDEATDDESLEKLDDDKGVVGIVQIICCARCDDGTNQCAGTFESRNEICEPGEDQSAYRVRVLPLRGVATQGGCLVMVDDVSQQLRADRAREEFVSQVTHELRTPLTNIRAYAETLSSGMFDDPKVVAECYNVITKETRRLSRLIEDILNVSQMEVGTIQLHVDSVDLGALLTESVRDVRGLAEEKSIDLRLTLPAKLEPIRADKDKLAVVVYNLLGNALKYTQREGTVIVGCKIGTSDAMITVKDNGIGISPEDQRRVFEKFQRGEDPDVQNQTGTGIGLYTAREIVRRHGGEIELMSERGTGSTFIVKLPHVQSRATAMTSG